MATSLHQARKLPAPPSGPTRSHRKYNTMVDYGSDRGPRRADKASSSHCSTSSGFSSGSLECSLSSSPSSSSSIVADHSQAVASAAGTSIINRKTSPIGNNRTGSKHRAARASRRSSPAPSDCLEVNELLYLRKVPALRLEDHSNKRQARDAAIINHHGEIKMSEFSAFTLRKISLRRKQTAASARDARPGAGGQSAPSIKLIKAPEPNQANDDCCSCCCCCSCSGGCSQDEDMPKPMAARATKPTDQASGEQIRRRPTQLASEQLRASSQQTALRRHNTSSATMRRRPLPVPPPVVPLYKELALLSDETEQETSDQKSTVCSLMNLQEALKASSSVTDDKYGNNWKELTEDKQHQLAEKQTRSCIDIVQEQDAEAGSSQTLARRTGKLFERLKQTLLSSLPVTLSQQQCELEALTTSLTHPEPIDNSTDPSGDIVEQQPIYDTPEACDYQQGKPAVLKPAKRPAIPPPLPPVQLGDCVGLAPQQQAAKPTRATALAPVSGLSSRSTRAPNCCHSRELSSKAEQTIQESHLISLERKTSATAAVSGSYSARKLVKWATSQGNKRRQSIEAPEVEFKPASNDISHGEFKLKPVTTLSAREAQQKNPISDSQRSFVRFDEIDLDYNNNNQIEVIRDKSKAEKPRDHELAGQRQPAAVAAAGGESLDRRRQELNLKLFNELKEGQRIRNIRQAQQEKQQQQARGSRISSFGTQPRPPSEGMGSNQSIESSGGDNDGAAIVKSQAAVARPNKREANKCNGSIKSLSIMTNKLLAGVDKQQHTARATKLAASNKAIQTEPEASRVDQEQQQQHDSQASQLELEKRRASIRNGDVFIYPSIYTDLNECHKCLRDKLICNCNSAMAADKQASQPRKTPTSSSSSSGSNTFTSSSEPAAVTGSADEPAKRFMADHRNQTSAPESAESKVVEPTDRHSAGKRSYKISISTALINQKSNQIKLSNPEISVPPTTTTTKNRSTTVNRDDQQTKPQIKPRTTLIGSEQLKIGAERLRSANVINSNSDENGDEKQKNRITAISIGSLDLDLPERDPNVKLSPLLLINGDSFIQTNGSTETIKVLENVDETTCDNTKGQLLQDERRLTCNIDVGDAIKITSTSIRIGKPEAGPLASESLVENGSVIKTDTETSIIPIRTPIKRRNPVLLSRQPIHEDDNYEDQTSDYDIISSRTLKEENSEETTMGSNDNSVADAVISGGAFEYSPILNSVRDYIKNYNSDLQTAAPQALVSQDQTKCLAAATLDNAQQLESSSSGGGGTKALVTSSALMLNPLLPVPAGSTINGTNNVDGEPTIMPVDGSSDSFRKSIFEGASKDEILEYLEDARERVPEILMAADDVMVINETELIVVNQLEPDSPATPISIVDPAEEAIPLMTSPISDNDSMEIQPSTDQIRQHLRQIYKSSQLASDSSQLSAAGDDPMSAPSSSPPSNNNSSEALASLAIVPTAAAATAATRSLIIANRLTLDSIDSDQLNTINELPALDYIGGDDQAELARQRLAINDPGDDRRISSSAATATDNEINENLFLNRRSLRRKSVRLCNSSLSNASNNSANETQSSILDFSQASNVFAGRRNSSSGDDSHLQMNRNCAMQMLLMQMYPNNRDSLSSSSSPPSSASPSSSTSSSNQTSGNCSAASNFYASSSLSNSSPLLMLSNNISSPTGMSPSNNGGSLTATPNNNSNNTAAVFYQTSLLAGLHNNLIEHQKLKPIEDLESVETAPSAATLLATDKLLSKALNRDGDFCLGAVKQLERKVDMPTPIMDDPKAPKQTLAAARRATLTPTFSSSANLMSKTTHGHYVTMSRLNHYFLNRHPNLDNSSSEAATIEFQCLDCDQFIDVDQTTMLIKTNELRMLRETEGGKAKEEASDAVGEQVAVGEDQSRRAKPMSPEQLDRAYIAAMNGLPLCKTCEKKRIERKEIIAEFVDTEVKYGRDLKIIHEEFYRPMQIAGLLNKDQINGVFLNLEELIMAHCRFADRLGTAINEAHSMGDSDYNTINIGKLFVESAEMLHTFESYCIRQGSAACLLARLAKEKELLRIFLRVSQMENTSLRRMNLAAFLMVPVQRVTRYPLLLNRLYKVTAYHHKDREALRDAQLKVELHLEHINQQTRGVGATNKIWRRISNLSAPISSRRGLINAEDIGYIKLRKTAMDMLKWDRDETQFIHSGKLNFTPLNEFLTKTKAKSMRYMTAHALLIVLGKPNWKYRPDMVKSNLDSKLMTPTPGGNGIKETALLLFREKNGRFVACREPFFLSNCILSADCTQYNSEYQASSSCQLSHNSSSSTAAKTSVGGNSSASSPLAGQTMGGGKSNSGAQMIKHKPPLLTPESSISDSKSNSIDSASGYLCQPSLNFDNNQQRAGLDSAAGHPNSSSQDGLSMSSMRSLPEEHGNLVSWSPPVASAHASRSYSLASALPGSALPSTQAGNPAARPSSVGTSSNTIFNQLITKVNNYHKQSPKGQAHDNSSHQQALLRKGSPTNNNTSQQQPAPPSESLARNSLDANNNQCHTSLAGGDGPAAAAAGAGQQQVQSGANQGKAGEQMQHYNHYFHNHHQLYGDYEESFEIHERLSKESLLLKADTPLKTRYWLQMLRYHAKDLGQWRSRRGGLANIMMMRTQE